MAVIPAKAEALFNSEAGQSSAFCTSSRWMIRCAHPFGAILRMFAALRATSGLRRGDDEVLLRLDANQAWSRGGSQFGELRLNANQTPEGVALVLP